MLSPNFSGRTATSSVPRPSFSHDFTATSTLPAGGTFTRSSAALYYDAGGFLASAAINTPRFGYDYLSHEKLGLVMEEAVTAKNTYARPSAGTTSNHFSSVPGILSIVTDSNNPAKNLSAGVSVWKLDNSAGGSSSTISFAGTTGNTNKHSLQIWAKVISGSGGSIDLGGSGTANLIAAAWTYVESANVTPPNSSAQMRITVAAGATILFTCANLQENIFNTHPIDTAGSSASRTAEKLVVTLGSWFSATKGAFVLDHIQVGTARRAAQATLYLGAGNNNDRLMIGVNADGGHSLRCFSGGTGHVNVNIGNTILSDRRMTEAFSYTAASFTASLNGAISGRYAIGALPTSFSSGLLIACHPSAGSEYTGYIKRIDYYKQALTENQLRALTRPRKPFRFTSVNDPNLDMILIAGQSNAVGMAPLTGLPSYTYASKMKTLGNDDVLKAYADPYDSASGQKDSTSTDSNPGFSFCGVMMDNLIATTGHDTCVVPCAKGGSAVVAWAPETAKDAALYISLLRRAYLAREYGRLRALVWFQGEEDALVSTSGATYTQRLSAFLERLRADLDDPSFPVVIVSLHNEPPPPGSRPTWGQIQSAHTAFSGIGIGHAAAAGCAVISGDEAHLSVAGHTTLGQRIAPVLASLLGS